jgi:hypothetical protein
VPDNIAFDKGGVAINTYPDIAVYDHSRFHAMIYLSADSGMRYVLYDESHELTQNSPIAPGSSQQFGTILFAADGTRYIVWQDSKNDAGDIYFAKETSALPRAAVTRSLNASYFSVFPNPVATQNVMVSYSITAPATVHIIDLLGRDVYHTLLLPNETSKQITVSNLPAGIYQCVLEGTQMREGRVLVIER